MLYSNLFVKKEKKVPILFLVPLITVIIFVNFFFNKTSLPTRALGNFPRQIKILKLAENQITIFWETYEKEASYLLFGESANKINQIALDDRDTQSFKVKRFFHIVTFNKLKHNHNYFFRIVTEKKIFNDLNGQPFTFKTGLKKERTFVSSPLYGKVVDKAGRGLSEAILVFNFDHQPLAVTYSKTNGNWLIVLRRWEKSFSEEEVIVLDIYSEGKEKSQIKGTIRDFSPLGIPIIIGKNYDLTTNQENVLSSSVGRKNQEAFELLYPKDKVIIPGWRPLIKGLGFYGKDVDVVLKSKSTYSFRTKVDKNGQWQVSINFDLLPGDYFLEASSTDDKGNNLKKAASFKIIKSGEQVLGEATPSATLIPSPTLFSSPTVTPSPTISPTIYKAGYISSYLFSILAFVFVLAGVFLILAY